MTLRSKVSSCIFDPFPCHIYGVTATLEKVSFIKKILKIGNRSDIENNIIFLFFKIIFNCLNKNSVLFI